MRNKVQIFIKTFSFYIKPEFPCKVLKFVFKAYYSDQAFWDFSDTRSTFLLSVEKD